MACLAHCFVDERKRCCVIGGRGAAPPDESQKRSGPTGETAGPDRVVGELPTYQLVASPTRIRGPFPVSCPSILPFWRGQESSLRFYVDCDWDGLHRVTAKWGGGRICSVGFSTREGAQAELLRWLAYADYHDNGDRLSRREQRHDG